MRIEQFANVTAVREPYQHNLISTYEVKTDHSDLVSPAIPHF
jgi:hypothetical protein